MISLKKYRLLLVAAAIVAVCAVAAVAYHQHYRSMRVTLMDLQAQNQADTVFRSDSLQLRLVHFFDRHAYTPSGLLHPGRTANERLLAHYLLGRAYADMGDAPMAIHAYREAVDCADTTAADCDYAVLRSVYGQMAYLFQYQALPKDAIQALLQVKKYDTLLGDTLDALSAAIHISNAYILHGDTATAMKIASETANSYKKYGLSKHLANAYNMQLIILINQKKYGLAKPILDLVRSSSYYFINLDTVTPGHELLYYYLGQYYTGIDKLDSAEHYFRKTFFSGYEEAACKGLLSIYNSKGIIDSVAKYAQLYVASNDKSYAQKQTFEVERMSKLYDYSRHIDAANKRQQTILLYERITIFTAFVICLSMVVLYNIGKRLSRTRNQKIRKLIEKYTIVLSRQKESNILLSKEIKELGVEISYLKNEISKYKAKDVLPVLKQSNIAQEFWLKANMPHKYESPTVQEWGELFDVFEPCFSNVFEYFKQIPKWSIIESQVCVLSVLDFQTGDMAVLMNQKKQNINKIKTKINRLLFEKDGAKGLAKQLEGLFLQLASPPSE